MQRRTDRQVPQSVRDSAFETLWTWLGQQLGMRALLATPATAIEDASLPDSRLSAHERRVLVRLFGSRVREDRAARAANARFNAYEDVLRIRAGDLSHAPDAVVRAESSEDVLKLLAVASEYDIAVQARSVLSPCRRRRPEGRATIALDLSGMNALETVDGENRRAIAQAGIGGPALEAALSARGLTLGHFPDVFPGTALGDWIASGSPGQQSLMYGGPTDWLISADAATPSGTLHGGNFHGDGPGLRELLIGTDDAFGIVTRAMLRLKPLPSRADARAFLFRDLLSAIAAMQEAVKFGVAAAMLRVSDPDESRVLGTLGMILQPPSWFERTSRLLRKAHRSETACLLIAEFEGAERQVRTEVRRMSQIARRHDAISLGQAPASRWINRRFDKHAWRRALLDHGLGVQSFEISTTWEKQQAVYAALKTALRTGIGSTLPRLAHGLVLCHFMAASRDEVRFSFDCLFPRALDAEIAQARTVAQAFYNTVGSQANRQPRSVLTANVLQGIKQALDPKGILNPVP